MAENGETNGGGAAEAQQQQPQPVKMQVLGQYIRDMSFENIVAQKGTSGDVTPDIKVQVALDARKRPADNQYEVNSKFSVNAKNKGTDDTLFVLELDYGGLFHIENVPDDQIHPFLLIECPRMLFPFVRRIVSDMTRDGGFAPLNLENVDFVALYRQELARRAEQQKAEQQPVS